MLNSIVAVLSLLEFSYCFHPRHRPVRKFPCFRPPYIHVFGIYYHNYQFKIVVPDTCAQAWSSIWRNTRFDTVDSSLSQHQVSIVPFICSFVSICIFLHDKELLTYNFSELLNLHTYR